MKWWVLLIVSGFSCLNAEPWPGETWLEATPETVGMDSRLLEKARTYALTGEGSGLIIRHGKVVSRWGDEVKRYDLKSTTKSFGATAVGVALKQGLVKLDEPAQSYYPGMGSEPDTNVASGWLPSITIRHLLTQTAGFEKPGGFSKLLFKPGTKWDYSDSGPNWLADCLTPVLNQDLETWMFEKVFSVIGIDREDLRWRSNQYRPKELNGVARREFGSGIHANVDAMARLGLLYLHEGRWNDQVVLTPEFVSMASRPDSAVQGLSELNAEEYGNASDHYGWLWWNNADGTLADVPRDAFWSWGLYDSMILVIPSLDIVVARAGKSWERKWSGHYDVLAPFFTPIVQSATGLPLIKTIVWAPKEQVIRLAEGGDNWPITWGDDDAQYTAYGDGWGFEPKVPNKLSLGFAKVVGVPEEMQGINIRTESGEAVGQGKDGRKASGMLMVDSVLYVLTRNVGNSQLGWSEDHGKTWIWASWKFTESLGAPTFLNYGRNYAGAIDDYVYVYSFDSDSAYEAADRMVLARVPKTRLRERLAYEFFVSLGDDDGPMWSSRIDDRGAVFTDPGRCYRSGVSYNAAIGRFLWAQIKGTDDTRFRGGLAVYEAQHPWGPWVQVYHQDPWDIGPGESASFPTKWMSEDGKELQLVFSGNDYFSIRKATLVLRRPR